MSIYSIANYSAGTYNTWDIVRYPSNTNDYFYSLKDGNTDTPAKVSTSWGGFSLFNGIYKPKFLWRHNYGGATQHEPATLEIKFEGSYSQRIVQNINNDMLKLQLVFDLRTEKETAAIIHFLYARSSKESFLFTPSSPHDLEKLFICKSWSEQYNYFNNHTIQCLFKE